MPRQTRLHCGGRVDATCAPNDIRQIDKEILMQYPTKLAVAFTAGTLLLTLAACGDDGDTQDADATQTATNGDVFNDADLDFATAMIPHHAQALAMVDMTRGRELSPQVQRLTEDIQAAQVAEIERMVDWLTGWDQPVPETMRDHANAEDPDGMGGHDMDDPDGDDRTGSAMPGMMSDEELADLGAAHGREFEDMWLAMMIEHHEGAIEMAKDEQADGVYRPALDLAKSIATSQQAEIDQMRELLAS
jgi:uncharacterized protein (DUF305 family)